MTMQIPDRLIFEGKQYGIVSGAYPMDAFPSGLRPSFPSFSTACWRGYVATWVISDGALCISSMSVHRANDDTNLIADIFPDVALPVKATWVNGKVVASGGGVKYHGYYGSVSNEYLLLTVKRGVIVDSQIKESKWFINAYPSIQRCLEIRDAEGAWRSEIDPAIKPVVDEPTPPLTDDPPPEIRFSDSRESRKDRYQKKLDEQAESLVRHKLVVASLRKIAAMDDKALVDAYVALQKESNSDSTPNDSSDLSAINKAAVAHVVMERIEGGDLLPLKGSVEEVFPVRRYMATIDDPKVFVQYVCETEAWELFPSFLDAATVRSHIQDKGKVPPGIGWQSVRELRTKPSDQVGCELWESSSLPYGKIDVSMVLREAAETEAEGRSMVFKKGERVRHPKKAEWGVGQVQADCTGGSIRIFFESVGEKTLSLEYVIPERVTGDDAVSPTLDKLSDVPADEGKKLSCKNCGGQTQFGERADPERVALGWCDPCFKHSKRTFKDSVTGQERYFDELRTIDGIKNRYSPK